MLNAVLDKAEKIARAEIGYREGPKDNETKFGAWFGMNFVSWCAIFQSWVSFFSGTTYLGKPWRFASTISARDHAKKNKRWTTVPTVGTIAMMAHSSTTGHVGFVIALLMRDGQLLVVTIEGNTNDQGAREGNGVWLRIRAASSWDGYIVLDQTYLKDAPSPPQTDEEEEMKQKYLMTPDGNGIIVFGYNEVTKSAGLDGKILATPNEFYKLTARGWLTPYNPDDKQEKMDQETFDFLTRGT